MEFSNATEKAVLISVAVPTLHLSNCEVCIQPVHSSQEQQFGGRDGQELLGQALKPACPVGGGGSEVYTPCVLTGGTSRQGGG